MLEGHRLLTGVPENRRTLVPGVGPLPRALATLVMLVLSPFGAVRSCFSDLPHLSISGWPGRLNQAYIR